MAGPQKIHDTRHVRNIALVGPTGAGTTTLFLRLCGGLAGKPGQATVGGLDPAGPEQRRKLPETVGVVFQNPDDQLFSPTVLEDVAFGPLNLGATRFIEKPLNFEHFLKTILELLTAKPPVSTPQMPLA